MAYNCIVGGKITETTGGTDACFADENIVYNCTKTISFKGDEGICFEKPKTYKPKTDLLVTKVEGPFDDNDKLVKVVKKGVSYTYKASLNRDPEPEEIKMLRWATKNDDGKINELTGVSAHNGLKEKKILIGIAVNEDCEKARIYAYYKKASEKVSLLVNIRTQFYRFNPSSYMAKDYSKLLSNFYVTRENWHANPPILNENRSFDPYILVQKTNEKYIQDKQAIPTLIDSFFGIAIHHSGNSGIKTMTEVQEEHVNGKNKFADVGYHFGIDLSGVVYEGRYIGVKGSHLTKYNTGIIGIVFLADFDHDYFWDTNGDDEMSNKALSATITLINSLKEQYPNINVLGGHQEWKNNVGERRCPGEYGMSYVDALRKKLKMKSPKETGHG